MCVPGNSYTCPFVPFRTVYCDETADESSGVNVHQPTAFAHKLLQLSGVSLFWDEFSASAKSSPVCSTAPVVRKMKQSPRHWWRCCSVGGGLAKHAWSPRSCHQHLGGKSQKSQEIQGHPQIVSSRPTGCMYTHRLSQKKSNQKPIQQNNQNMITILEVSFRCRSTALERLRQEGSLVY